MVLGQPVIGDTLANRFEIRREIGAGGMGVVYEVLDRLRQEIVALKIMRRRVDHRALSRFKLEFRALADLHHPNLISLYELVESEGTWFFTMELVHGEDLRTFGGRAISLLPSTGASAATASMAAGRPVPTPPSSAATSTATATALGQNRPGVPAEQLAPARQPVASDQFRPILRQLALGIATLHDARRLHLDIKPSNVLIDASGRAVLCDFGLVTDLVENAHQESLAGTAAYVAPEQAARGQLSPASDWFAFGALMYEGLCGRAPFAGATMAERAAPASPALPPLPDSAPPDLAELCLELLAHAPADRPDKDEILRRLGCRDDDGTAAATSLVGHGDAPLFVGRDSELATLFNALETARDGQGHLVQIVGESSFGKTALATHFLDRAERDHDALVLRGRCYRAESVPFKGFDAAVEDLARFLDSVRWDASGGDQSAALRTLFPSLGREGDEALVTHSDVAPADLRRTAFGQLRALLRRISEKKQVVIFLDDLQWGDLDAGALLVALLRNPAPPPVLVLATVRAEEEDSSPLIGFLREQERHLPDVETVRLAQLGTDETMELAAKMLGGASDRARQVAEESGGNPLLIRELSRAAPTQSNDHSLLSLLSERIRTLPDAPQSLLTAVAIADRPIPEVVAARAARIPRGGQTVLTSLASNHLVRTLGAGSSPLVECFHASVREAVLQALDESDVRRWHRRLARSYSQEGSVEPEVLVEHYLAAGDRDKAAAHVLAAARAAADSFAFDRAARLYNLALELDTEHDVSALLLRLSDVQAAAGDGAAAGRTLQRAAMGLDGDEQLDCKRRAAELLLQSGYVTEGRNAVEEFARHVGVRIPSSSLAVLGSLLARRAWLRLRGLDANVDRSAEISGRRLQRLDVLWTIATGLSLINPIPAAECNARYLLAALRVGEPYRIALGYAIEVGQIGVNGSRTIQRVAELEARARTFAKTTNEPHAIGLVELASGIAAFLRGAFAGAQSRCQRARRILEGAAGHPWETASSKVFEFGARMMMGEFDTARRTHTAHLRDAEERGNLYLATQLRVWLGTWVWLSRGDVDTAVAQIGRAQREWKHPGTSIQDHYVLMAEAAVALYSGGARELLETINGTWKRHSRALLYQAEIVFAEARDMRGRAALATWMNDRDSSLLKVAARDGKGLLRIPLPYARGFGWLLRAGVETLDGDQTRAAAGMQSALEEFTKAHMPVHAAAARFRRGELLDDVEQQTLAIAELENRGIATPERWIRMLAPASPGARRAFSKPAGPGLPAAENRE